jgi:hypothetical protein
MTKKPINWIAIQKRYLLGEKPKDIAMDYGLTAKQISDKAHDDGWTRKKAKISEEIEADVQEEVKTLVGQAQAFMKAVFGHCMDKDGGLNVEGIRELPGGVISACLSRALPNGIPEELSEDDEPGLVINILPYSGDRSEIEPSC